MPRLPHNTALFKAAVLLPALHLQLLTLARSPSTASAPASCIITNITALVVAQLVGYGAAPGAAPAAAGLGAES